MTDIPVGLLTGHSTHVSVPLNTSRYSIISLLTMWHCADENLDMPFKLHIFTYYQDIVQTPSTGSLIGYNMFLEASEMLYRVALHL